MDDDEVIEIESLEDPQATREGDDDASRRPGPRRPDPVVIEDDGADGGADPGAELKQQLAAAKRRTEDAIRLAGDAQTRTRQVEGELHQERQARQTTELSALDQEIAALKSAADAAGDALKAALDAGENAKAVDLQRKLARAEAQLLGAEERKRVAGDGAVASGDRRDLRGGGAVRTEQPAPRTPSQQEYVDSVLAQVTPRVRAWFQNGRLDYITDPEKAAQAGLVHQRAVKAGITPDTDEYFDFAEQELAKMSGEGEQRRAPRTPAAPRKRPVVAAPVDRGGGGGGGDGGNGDGRPRVKLSEGQRRSATDGTLVWNTGPKKGQPIGVQEMARRVYLQQQAAEGREETAA